MRVFLLVCLIQALICTEVFGDLEEEKEHQDENVKDNAKEIPPFEKIVPGNMKFAYSLYNHLAEKYPKDNLFFAPTSIVMLLGMLSVGAKGQTQTQIYEALHFNMSVISEEDINTGLQQLLSLLNQPTTDLEINSANVLFLGQHTKLCEKFSKDLKNFYDSEVIPVDFKNEDEAKNQINNYVEKKTNGKIKNLLQSVSPQTLLALINTIYFKGNLWMSSTRPTGKMY